MFVGGAIADALGAPIETWTPKKVEEVHGGRVDRYVPAIGHKWFKEDEFPVGSTTDDTQLTLATAEGLIKGHSNPPSIESYMDGIAKAHCEAMKASTAGWGNSTVEAIRRLQNNVHWSQSGKTSNVHRGTGNGVPMKIAPLGAWLASPVGQDYQTSLVDPSFAQFCVMYSAMTHYTKMSAYAGLIHAYTIKNCLRQDDCKEPNDWLELWSTIFDWPNQIKGIYDVSELNDTEDDLQTQFSGLWGHYICNEEIKTDVTDKLFGGGSCYLFHSLPFTYARFLKDPTLKGMIDLINSGGDTDTNGSMFGQLIGALHGIEIFDDEEWAIEGLVGYEEIVATAEKFCDTFGVE
jgi:ADP-ribosylglycohydrolase